MGYNNTMKIFIGADHRGFHFKEVVFAYLAKRGIDTVDISEGGLDPQDDFPQIAASAVIKVMGEDNARAILLCGSGQGMGMAANRFNGIRAAVVSDTYEAKASRVDNDSNVLCLSSDVLARQDESVWKDILDTWIDTPFSGAARYVRRNRQLDELS